MSNFKTYVIATKKQEITQEEYSRIPKSTRISYYNEIAENDSISITSDGDSSTALDLEYLSDYMNTSRYNFGRTGTGTINIETGEIEASFLCDHIAVAGVNWRNADITNVSVSIDVLVDENQIETTEVINVDTSTFDNNKVLMGSFASKSVSKISITFTATGTVSVSIIQTGLAFEFPSLPDDGFQPGAWNSIDDQSSLKTSTGNLGGVSIRKKGTEERYNFSFLPQEFMNEFWAPFIYDFKKENKNPIFIQWNPTEFPLDVIYGKIDIGSARYSTRIHGTISFNVKGLQGEL